MTPSDSVELFWSILLRGAVVVGLLMLVACVALVVAHKVEERKRERSRAIASRLGLYLEVEPTDEVAAAFRRQREAAEARRETRGGRL